MDKNKILEMSQKENKVADERYNATYRQGAQLAMAIGVLLCGIGMIIDILLNPEMTLASYLANAIQLSMWFTLYLVLSIKCRNKLDIIFTSVIGTVLVLWIVLFVRFIIASVGA